MLLFLKPGDRYPVWRRGFNVLATGHLLVAADPRFLVKKTKHGISLVIKHIREEDAGEYVCQVIAPITLRSCDSQF